MTSFDLVDDKLQKSPIIDEQPRVPLSTKYANLIRRARLEISKDAVGMARNYNKLLKDKTTVRREIKKSIKESN